MARRAATPSTGLNARRLAAVILLAVEASLWVGSMLFLVGPGVEGQVVMIIAVSFMALSLVAIFLLTQATRAGIWLGLGLQGTLVLYGLATTFVFAQLLGIVAVVMGVATALCLAAVANERPRR